MNVFKRLFTVFLTASVFITPVHLQAAPQSKAVTTQEKYATLAGLSAIEKESLRALVFIMIMQSKTKNLGKIPQDIVDRYNTVAKGIAYTPFIGSIGAGVVYLTQASFKELKSVHESFNVVIAKVGQALTASSDRASLISEKVGIDKALRFSGESIEGSFKAVAQLLAPLFTAGVAKASGAFLGSSFLGASSFITVYQARGAMTYSQVRALFGLDRALQNRISKVSSSLSRVFNLSRRNQNKFRSNLFKAVINQGIKTKFKSKKMKVNVLQALKPLLSSEELKALKVMRTLFKKVTDKTKSRKAKVRNLRNEMNRLLSMAIHLQHFHDNGNLSKADKRLVGNQIFQIIRIVKRVDNNFRK